MSRRLVLITGASAGIGAAFARAYAARGWDVALTARRADRLEGLAAELRDAHGGEALTVAADLANPAAPESLVREIEARGRSIDALVNNAGYSNVHGFAGSPWEKHRDFLQVMLHAPVELTHRVAAGMAERGFGRIVNVASLAGYTPGTAGDTLYGPTKSFLIKLSQSLHLELKDRGVHVTALCPGYTWSEFHDVNGSREEVTAAYPRWMWMDADTVVRLGIEASEANRAVCVPGASNKALAALMRTLPEDFTLGMAERHARRLNRL